ncbi:hypothetical protein [Geobacter sp.]|uniref:hypothetical protein n=1 Tax=Geobacter sp. TaxID=46610 RepID=UPI00261D4B5A|nr:hypothetical protein [Geobacter sp.]
MDEKEKQEISIIGRLLSMEALLVLMGIVSLVYGIMGSQIMNVFWGVVILVGAVVLSFVRKKDWKKHWEEQEEMRRRHEEQMKARKEGGNGGKG